MAKALTNQEKIERMKAWCVENYERGADTMVECWDDAEHARLLDQCGGNLKEAMGTLRDLAGIYRERQADARYEIEAGGGNLTDEPGARGDYPDHYHVGDEDYAEEAMAAADRAAFDAAYEADAPTREAWRRAERGDVPMREAGQRGALPDLNPIDDMPF